MIFRKTLVVTHNGTFHTDDVFATATASLVHGGKIRVVRSREPEDFAEADMVLDVGGEYDPGNDRFDHHQKGGAGVRENGVPYASFGLIWKKYGSTLCKDPRVAERVDKELVQFVDAMDNGAGVSAPVAADVYPYDVCRVISSFNPTWKEKESLRSGNFEEAVECAEGILKRLVTRCAHGIEASGLVAEAYEKEPDRRLVVLEKNLPWQDFIDGKPETLFVVTPRENGTWGAEAVKKGPKTFEVRKPFPASWAGLRDEELARETGVSDAVFCHMKLFLAVAKTREGAFALAKKALEA